MPLMRSEDEVLTSLNGVRFLMVDGGIEVLCRVSRELLRDKFGSNGDRDGNDAAFRLNRRSIEQAASDKYDAGELSQHGDARIVVFAADMASALGAEPIAGRGMDRESELTLKILLNSTKYAWRLYRNGVTDPIKCSVPIFRTEAAATAAGLQVLARVNMRKK
jgi:Protein of unknown function (DUF1488)